MAQCLAVSDVVITVDDKVAPAIPSDLAATPQAGELLVKWTQNSERDLSGYEIGFGLTNDPNQFIYSRNMGPKEVITGTNNIVDAKLWGLDDDTEIFYGLRAYDTSGNYSDWTPLQSGTPWSIAPNVWTPTPGRKGTNHCRDWLCRADEDRDTGERADGQRTVRVMSSPAPKMGARWGPITTGVLACNRW